MEKLILDKKQQITKNMLISQYAASLSNAFQQSAPHEIIINSRFRKPCLPLLFVY